MSTGEPRIQLCGVGLGAGWRQFAGYLFPAGPLARGITADRMPVDGELPEASLW